jgi:uncharacterized protein (DUF302 family)
MKTMRIPLVAITLLTLAGGLYAQTDPNRAERLSKYPFAETVRNLESALKSEHMMIVAKIDHKKMLSMVGAKISGATTIEFGKPAMGKMLLPMNPAIGLEMPSKIYVYETSDGKVLISYRKVAGNFATYGSPDVANAGKMTDELAEKIIGTLAR